MSSGGGRCHTIPELPQNYIFFSNLSRFCSDFFKNVYSAANNNEKGDGDCRGLAKMV